MNPNSAPSFWYELIGVLAVEVTLIVGAATLLARLARTASWRRTAWQVCFAGLCVLLVFEFTGLARGVASWGRARLTPAPSSPPVRSEVTADPLTPDAGLQLRDEFRQLVATRLARGNRSSVSMPAEAQAAAPQPTDRGPGAGTLSRTPSLMVEPTPTWPAFDSRSGTEPLDHWWIGAAWLLGAAGILISAGLKRFLFAVFRWHRGSHVDDATVEQVQRLAKRLGIRRRVRVVELNRLASPIAFGVIRPAVGLPVDFRDSFNRPQQDAMLVHELSHLSAHDPAWHLLADFAASVLWWHPLSWWARHQWRAASEEVADEASLLVQDGPGVLAECLVELGTRLAGGPAFGGLGVEGNGFRSSLGRRVERLVTLTGQAWAPPNRLRAGLARAAGPAGLAAAVILSTAWVAPKPSNNEVTMNTMRQSWKRSLAAFALYAALGTEQAAPGNSAAPVPKTATSKPLIEVQAKQITLDSQAGTLSATGDVQLTLAQQKMQAKQITLDSQAGTLSATGDVQLTLAQQKTAGDDGTSPSAERLAEPEALTSAKGDKAGLTPKGQDRQAVRAKLQQLVLEEVSFDGLPLNEVLKYLYEKSRELDPQKEGLNFVSARSPGTADAPAVDPNTGLPVATSPPVDLGEVSIRISPPLRHVRLLDLVDAITMVANPPVKYSIEDYGIVFSLGRQPPTRTSEVSETGPIMEDVIERMAKRYGAAYMRSLPGARAQAALGTGPADRHQPPLASKLEQIVLKEVFFDGLPLGEVVKYLSEKSRELDPEKRGVNFIVSNTLDAPSAASTLDPTTGLPVPSAPIDLNEVVVKLNLPLRNVRLKDALDAICKVAEKPIKYSLDDYAMVFSHDSAAPAGFAPDQATVPRLPGPLQVRTFRVDTNAFLTGLEGAFGINLSAQGPVLGMDLAATRKLQEAEEKLRRSAALLAERIVPQAEYDKAKAALEALRTDCATKQGYADAAAFQRAVQANRLQFALRKLLRQLGVNLDVPGKGAFYNEGTGILMVRGTEDDLKVVEAAVETLGGSKAVQETSPKPKPKRTVAVFGKVQRPGNVELPEEGEFTIIEAIAAAGGLLPTAKEGDIQATRQGVAKPFTFYMEELKKVTDPKQMFYLQPQDMIEVKERLF